MARGRGPNLSRPCWVGISNPAMAQLPWPEHGNSSYSYFGFYSPSTSTCWDGTVNHRWKLMQVQP